MSVPPRAILACTDYSPPSDAALRRAAALALRHHARLTLVHVIAVSAIKDAADVIADRYFVKDEPRFDPQRVERAEQARLQETAAALAAEFGIEVDVQLKTGTPATEIGTVAQQLAANLIVIGGHDAHRVRSRLLGTTTHRLLRQGHCPVLVAKPVATEAYNSILLPTDLSAASLHAAQTAASLWPDARFHALHVFELPFEGLLNYASIDPAALLAYEGEEHRRLAPELERFVQASALPAERTRTHLARGRAAERIVEFNATLATDLIVIAARGRSEVERLFIGSVALNVVQVSDGDVLLVRSESPAEAHEPPPHPAH